MVDLDFHDFKATVRAAILRRKLATVRTATSIVSCGTFKDSV